MNRNSKTTISIFLLLCYYIIMKKKIVVSLIFVVMFVVALSTLFFSESLEYLLKFKPNLSRVEEAAFEVHFIDVGQGDCIAIRFPNEKTMLVDSGPISGGSNLDEYLDKVFFKDNYNTFDYVFLTHSDIDHSGNMEFILNNYNVKNFYRPYIYSQELEDDKMGFKVDNKTYDGILTLLNEKDITTYFSSDNSVIDTGAGTIEIFTANSENVDEPNDYSPFLIISSNNDKVYLSGDIGEKYELEMVERGCLPEVELMKLAHHGSKYSNSEKLIEVLSPKYVACSVGENTYGHPTSEVLLRLAKFDEKYNETTYDSFKSTLNNGNLIYYTNVDSEMEVIEINNLGDYLFLDWFIVVIISESVIVVIYLTRVLPNKPLKFNKHLKNMKR